MGEVSKKEVEEAALSYDEISSVDRVSEYGSGMARSAFKVEASSGNYVVYVCSDTRDHLEERFSKEEELLELVEARTEIPTNEIIKSDFTKEQIPYLFYIAPEIDGYDPIDRFKYLPRDQKKHIVRQAGRFLGELHREVEFEGAGRLRNDKGEIRPEGVVWSEYLQDWAEKWIGNFVDTPFEDLQEKAFKFFQEHRYLAEPGGNVCLHFDVTPDNLIIKEGEVQALIDWEKAISGRPEWDLAYARIQMIYRWFNTEEINKELEKELLEGYFEENELNPGWRKRLVFFSQIWNFKSMAKFEKHFRGVSEEEKREEARFFREHFMRNFEDLEESVEEEMKY